MIILLYMAILLFLLVEDSFFSFKFKVKGNLIRLILLCYERVLLCHCVL